MQGRNDLDDHWKRRLQSSRRCKQVGLDYVFGWNRITACCCTCTCRTTGSRAYDSAIAVCANTNCFTTTGWPFDACASSQRNSGTGRRAWTGLGQHRIEGLSLLR
jgi:hypothetical protein